MADLLSTTLSLIDKVIPDPAAKQAAQLKLLELQQTGELAQLNADTDLAKGQLAVNQVEAANPSVFIGGWRPFIGWVCGAGLAYQYLLAPLLTWGALLFGRVVQAPQLDLGTLITLLFGMMGLSISRSFEKLNGVASK